MQRCSKLSYITLLSFPTCFAPIDFRVVGIIDGPIAALDSGQPSKRVCVSVCVCVCVCLSVRLTKVLLSPTSICFIAFSISTCIFPSFSVFSNEKHGDNAPAERRTYLAVVCRVTCNFLEHFVEGQVVPYRVLEKGEGEIATGKARHTE